MIQDKTLRLIWIILFIAVFPATIYFKSDYTFVILFAVVSGGIFILDFSKLNKHYKKFGSVIAIKRRWHIFSNFTQWMFWTALIVIPFNPNFELKYKIFVMIDIFVISTFSFMKFNKINI